MKIIPITFLSLFICLCSRSQPVLPRDGGGGMRIATSDGYVIPGITKYQEEGITSIPETNCSVIILTRENKLYRNFKGRIDLRLQKLVFNIDGQDLVCTLPLEQIVFDSCEERLAKAPFRNGFPAIDKQNEESFYQVLCSGKTVLLKFYGSDWQETSPYNATTTIRTYKEVISYYLLTGTSMKRLEKKNSNLLSVIHVPESFLKENKLSPGKEDDLIRIVTHYNSL